ncbi:PepSY domain-containing protein [Micromonospora rifamycinica]|uniref:PepSY domain-containing protein n=1 Tax=Micromonospora rifamycinica TaxID=291594 RepID=UPI002E2BC330|nr:PepSY domain-containing protein [Micromonospora rifamycinica]
MKRTSLLLAAAGGAAVLAVTGTALGVSAAERAPAPTPVAETTAPAPAADAVSRQRAGEIALAKVGGGQITEIEREQEAGRPVWSVEIVDGDTEHEVEVDRDSGAVVKSEQEKADADDRSGRDDDADDRDDDQDDDRDDSDDGDDD